jgi:hypothetical protein
MIRIQPELSVAADPVRSATILFDTSASRALALDDSLLALAGCESRRSTSPPR